MSVYTFKASWFFKWLYPKYLWKKNPSQCIYLTFDDGPTPGVTEEVLRILKVYHAQATFFLIGKNALLYPDLTEKILNEGHSIGNHTHNHLNGWQNENKVYLENVTQAETALPFTRLFRPAYGKIKRKQAQALIQKGYQIVMWDVLSGDFDPDLSAEKCLTKVMQHTSDGSIVVFHDSLKARSKVLDVLPKVLENWTKAGFTFKALN
jgi:peptidoglycan/xylan/chitin deacetylase (PgdA/CDA1 family)